MAVKIDNVYQRVLTIANKEQRGYITPQEFNLLAYKAQMDIFESYFYNYESKLARPNLSNDTAIDTDILYEKILPFKKSTLVESISSTEIASTEDCNRYLFFSTYDKLKKYLEDIK